MRPLSRLRALVLLSLTCGPAYGQSDTWTSIGRPVIDVGSDIHMVRYGAFGSLFVGAGGGANVRSPSGAWSTIHYGRGVGTEAVYVTPQEAIIVASNYPYGTDPSTRIDWRAETGVNTVLLAGGDTVPGFLLRDIIGTDAQGRLVGTAKQEYHGCGGCGCNGCGGGGPRHSILSGPGGLQRSSEDAHAPFANDADRPDSLVWSSVDDGKTWTSWTRIRPMGFAVPTAIAFETSSLAYAGGYNTSWTGSTRLGVASSSDGGRTWSPLSTPFPTDPTTQGIVSQILPVGGGTLLVALGAHYDDVAPGDLWRFTPSPAAWQRVLTNVRRVVRLPDGRYVAATTDGLYATSNGGQTWTDVTGTLPTRNLKSIDHDGQGRITVATSTYQVFTASFASPSGSWSQEEMSLSGVVVYGIAVRSGPSRAIFAATYGSGVYRTRDDGRSWQQVGTRATGLEDLQVWSVFVHPVSGDVYAGTYNGGLFVSRDDGNTWQKTTLDAPQALSIAHSPDGAMLVGTNNGVYRSTDGATWTPIGPYNKMVWGVMADGATLYAGTRSKGLYRSTDAGASWHEYNTGLATTSIYSFARGPDGTVYAGTKDGVYRLDSGRWTLIGSRSRGLTKTDVRGLAVLSSGAIYAGVWGGGIFRSTDGGLSWSKAGLVATQVSALGVDPSTGALIVASEEGLFMQEVGAVTGVDSPPLPGAFRAQIGPNPARGPVTVHLNTTASCDVTVRLTDLLGRTVMQTTWSELSPGGHTRTLETETLAPGTYVVNLSTPTSRSVHSLVVTR